VIFGAVQRASRCVGSPIRRARVGREGRGQRLSDLSSGACELVSNIAGICIESNQEFAEQSDAHDLLELAGLVLEGAHGAADRNNRDTCQDRADDADHDDVEVALGMRRAADGEQSDHCSVMR